MFQNYKNYHMGDWNVYGYNFCFIVSVKHLVILGPNVEVLTIVCSSDCHDCCLGWILCFILSSYNMDQRFFLYLKFWKEPLIWLLHMDYHNCCLECCTEQLQCGSANTSGNFWALEIKNFPINISMIRDHPFKTSANWTNFWPPFALKLPTS